MTMPPSIIDKSIITLSKHIQISTKAYLCKYKKNQRVELIKNNNIAYLKSGSVSVYRKEDNLIVTRLDAPFILGLTQMFNDTKYHYFRCNTMCEMWEISSESASNIFNNNNLWELVFNITSWHMNCYFQRDIMITQPNNKEIIREHIKFIWSMSPEIRKSTSVYSFIMLRNHISRSMIHKIIQELSVTQNVKIEKGKLIHYEDSM